MYQVVMSHAEGAQYVVAEFEGRSDAEQYIQEHCHELNDEVCYELRDPQGRYLESWSDAEGMSDEEFIEWLTT